jgi:hypothetical protein
MKSCCAGKKTVVSGSGDGIAQSFLFGFDNCFSVEIFDFRHATFCLILSSGAPHRYPTEKLLPLPSN